MDEWARVDELHRERDAARQEAAHHGAWAAYYYAAYRSVVPPGMGLPDYSERAGRLEGAMQAPDRRQAPPPGPAPAVEGGSQTWHCVLICTLCIFETYIQILDLTFVYVPWHIWYIYEILGLSIFLCTCLKMYVSAFMWCFNFCFQLMYVYMLMCIVFGLSYGWYRFKYFCENVTLG